MSDESPCDGKYQRGEDDLARVSASILVAEQNHITKSCTGRQTGNQTAHANNAGRVQLGQYNRHRTARNQADNRADDGLDHAVLEHERCQAVGSNAMKGKLKNKGNHQKQNGRLKRASKDAANGSMVAATAAAVSHIELDLVILVLLPSPHKAQHITADDGKYKFRAKQNGNLGARCTLREQDGQCLIRRRQKNRDQGCRSQITVGKQRGSRCGKTALRDKSGQSADHRAELG